LRVPLSWLKDFTPIEVDVFDEAAVRELANTLDGLGLVVESIETVGGALPGVVLARIMEIHAIEGADRVRKVLVDDGERSRLEIVCGATNFALGDVVPLATIGTRLPGGMVIAERRMRGATSNGMLCSEKELEIADDAAGLMIVASPGGVEEPLPEAVRLGRRLDDYLGLVPEVVFDVAVEPNRPDALSIAGIARDLAAKLGLAFSIPSPVVAEGATEASALASVAIKTGEGCSAVVGRVLQGVAEVASPTLVRRRLELAGVRQYNAVVDASNYVMLEFGQPTHAYDLDRLGGHGIVVRMARSGEELTTLDGERRVLGRERLPDGDVEEIAELVIADVADTPVGVAGVMGGLDTEIMPATTTVLLEVANFDSLFIGRTSARLGLRSEASQRFWRGVDPLGLERAADRFCELVQQAAREADLAVPLAASGTLRAEVKPYVATEVSLRVERVNTLLGTSLTKEDMLGLLVPIGFDVRESEGRLVVTIPSWRVDATREVDVIEEIARHYGYERIGRSERRSPRVGVLTSHQARRRRLRAALIGAGVTEAWTSSIVDPRAEAATGSPGPYTEVVNPIVRDETVLRTGLMGGLLGAIAYNETHRNNAVRLFEIGSVFGPSDTDGRPMEEEQLAVALSAGDDAASAMVLFRELAEAIGLDPDGYVLEQGEGRSLEDERLATGVHPSRSGVVMARRADPRTRPVVAVVGEVDPDVLRASGVQASRIGWIVASLEGLFSLPVRSPKAKPVSRQPSSDLDLAFVLDDEVPASRLIETIRRAAGELLESISLIDVYRGEGVAAGTRSLAVRLRLVALDRTLTDADLQGVQRDAIELVESRLPARLRR
jgi:phenylalanyl-tRNA synthetase beta chain